MGWPQKTPTGDFHPISVEFSSFGKRQSDKPVTVCTVYYGHVQNMTTGHYAELLLRGDEVSECRFPSMMLFSRMAHMLKSETPWVKHPSAGCTRCCLCSSPSPERWVNPWRKLFWTCLRLRGFDPTGHGNKTLGYQRAVGGSPVSERGTGPLAASCIPEGLQMQRARSRGLT